MLQLFVFLTPAFPGANIPFSFNKSKVLLLLSISIHLVFLDENVNIHIYLELNLVAQMFALDAVVSGI